MHKRILLTVTFLVTMTMLLMPAGVMAATTGNSQVTGSIGSEVSISATSTYDIGSMTIGTNTKVSAITATVTANGSYSLKVEDALANIGEVTKSATITGQMWTGDTETTYVLTNQLKVYGGDINSGSAVNLTTQRTILASGTQPGAATAVSLIQDVSASDAVDNYEITLKFTVASLN